MKVFKNSTELSIKTHASTFNDNEFNNNFIYSPVNNENKQKAAANTTKILGDANPSYDRYGRNLIHCNGSNSIASARSIDIKHDIFHLNDKYFSNRSNTPRHKDDSKMLFQENIKPYSTRNEVI